MKNSVSLLADFIKSSSKSNGAQHEPSLRARMKYGARLKRAARFADDEIDRLFRLTSLRRSRDLRFLD
jgi:hypothetical protein